MECDYKSTFTHIQCSELVCKVLYTTEVNLLPNITSSDQQAALSYCIRRCNTLHVFDFLLPIYSANMLDPWH